MKLNGIEINGKVFLAPLAGYTNQSYRTIMKKMGVDLVFTEMVSAKGLIYENDKTYEYIITNKDERPVAIQLFGGDIDDLVKATKIVCNSGYADIIDINMGCPVKKVLKQDAGSKLLQVPDKIYEMVKAIVKVSNVPVSVKIRAGWDHQSINCVEVSQAIEKAGASMITIHGRTKSDLYGGKVNLDYIKMVKEAVSIPVVGNGDIDSIDSAKKMFEYTNCDAIMIGRASLGNPWLVRDICDYFKGNVICNAPSLFERIEMIKRHYEALKKLKSDKIALLEMRTLAIWYMKSVSNSKAFKLAMVKVKNEQEFYELLDEFYEASI